MFLGTVIICMIVKCKISKINFPGRYRHVYAYLLLNLLLYENVNLTWTITEKYSGKALVLILFILHLLVRVCIAYQRSVELLLEFFSFIIITEEFDLLVDIFLVRFFPLETLWLVLFNGEIILISPGLLIVAFSLSLLLSPARSDWPGLTCCRLTLIRV